MEITITVPEEVERILEQRAAATGQDVKGFVEKMMKDQAMRPTLDEILAPVRKEFAESGMRVTLPMARGDSPNCTDARGNP